MKFSSYNTIMRYFENYDEWNRLFKDKFHQLEWLVTFHHLRRFLQPVSSILDAGGGPGRYSIQLAQQGHEVTLFDLSSQMLRLGRSKIQESSLTVQQRLKGPFEGSITDLCFKNELFDVVLALHPLSYLIAKADRNSALNELKRVLKQGGLLVLAVINRYGRLRNRLKESPEMLFQPENESLFVSGVHAAHDKNPDNYLFTPLELKSWIESFGFETLDMASCQGLSGGLREVTNRLSQNLEHWKKWVQLILETSNDPSIWGCGEHFVYFGRKT
ncbi:MAG: class I SAM-dependent methyltransferase [Candidatus Hodarchaeales archaeon]